MSVPVKIAIFQTRKHQKGKLMNKTDDRRLLDQLKTILASNLLHLCSAMKRNNFIGKAALIVCLLPLWKTSYLTTALHHDLHRSEDFRVNSSHLALPPKRQRRINSCLRAAVCCNSSRYSATKWSPFIWYLEKNIRHSQFTTRPAATNKNYNLTMMVITFKVVKSSK